MEPISVSEFVSDLKFTLEENYKDNIIVGEITNFSRSSAGHFYFTLSDSEAAMSCALFRADAMRNSSINSMKDGDKVVIVGPVSIYAKRGSLQIIVKQIRKYGVGDLKEKFERLKKKLAGEGLFDLASKKGIPLLPKKIAVITSARAAALGDFLNVIKRRSLWFDILIVPAVVQGEQSARSIIKALDILQKRDDIDVCVLTRGGGSLEDLWSFNDEALARKIFEMKIPVISAVGHQQDYTISDYVSDLRCETPTAAAEILSQEQTAIKDKLRYLKESLLSKMNRQKAQLSSIHQKFHPKMLLQKLWGYLLLNKKKLDRLNLKNRFFELTNYYDYQMELDDFNARLKGSLLMRFEKSNSQLERLFHVLNTASPKNTLNRGYCFVENEKGSVIASKDKFDSVSKKQKFAINFHDGKSYVEKI